MAYQITDRNAAIIRTDHQKLVRISTPKGQTTYGAGSTALEPGAVVFALAVVESYMVNSNAILSGQGWHEAWYCSTGSSWEVSGTGDPDIGA